MKKLIFLTILLFTLTACTSGLYKVSGNSMNPQLEHGQYIQALPAAEYSRGDIIVFDVPYNENIFFINRIVGLPGETVILEDGRLKIINDENPNGYLFDEDYLAEEMKTQTFPIAEGTSRFEIPENAYFTLGDNRTESNDSRMCYINIFQGACREGTEQFYITIENIRGKIK